MEMIDDYPPRPPLLYKLQSVITRRRRRIVCEEIPSDQEISYLSVIQRNKLTLRGADASEAED